MKRLVALCGNTNCGRKTLSLGLISKGWTILDINQESSEGLPRIVALQKTLAKAQGIDSDILIVGLAFPDQVTLIREIGGKIIFITRPNIDNSDYNSELLTAQLFCHESLYNNSDILTGQANLESLIANLS